MATSEQPKRRERLDTAARREQLIAVGRELFQQRPYDQVSMDDVAAGAGVSKGLIFHYFDSKRDLYVEIIGRGATDLMQASAVPDATAMAHENEKSRKVMGISSLGLTRAKLCTRIRSERSFRTWSTKNHK